MSREIQVEAYLKRLQEQLSDHLLSMDATLKPRQDEWRRPAGGGGRSRSFSGGALIESAGVNFSDVFGKSLPPSASRNRPQLAGAPFRAMGVSVVIHPLNPFVPTTHMNVRYFHARPDDSAEPGVWWFGGGFDLTPYYGFVEDARFWHQRARDAVSPWGDHLYPLFKHQCDQYFHLPHRNETRGIGGLFFDDFQEGGWDSAFAVTRSVGDHFGPAYGEIVERRREHTWTERERSWQCHRRGRYVEFNLLYDRGTLFGLQSGGRTESILMSMPPLVRWSYDFKPEEGSPEALLLTRFLKPTDWLNLTE